MTLILRNMTMQEAAPLWGDPRSVHLKRWGEAFDIPLDEFHDSHIDAYEKDRLGEVSYPAMCAEVNARRALLKDVGLGQEIESDYLTVLEKVKLITEEINGLSARARAYIEYPEEKFPA